MMPPIGPELDHEIAYRHARVQRDYAYRRLSERGPGETAKPPTEPARGLDPETEEDNGGPVPALKGFAEVLRRYPMPRTTAGLHLAGDAAGKDADLFILRRARKTHRCHHHERRDEDGEWYTFGRGYDHGSIPADCSGEIQAGEQYVEYVGEAPAFQAGSRYSRACALACGLAKEVAR